MNGRNINKAQRIRIILTMKWNQNGGGNECGNGNDIDHRNKMLHITEHGRNMDNN